MKVCLISKKTELKCGKISDAVERKINQQIGQFRSLRLKITFLEKLNKHDNCGTSTLHGDHLNKKA